MAREDVQASGDGATLAESWDGEHWHLEATPNPQEAHESYLEAISCVAAQCFAVGADLDGTETLGALFLNYG